MLKTWWPVLHLGRYHHLLRVTDLSSPIGRDPICNVSHLVVILYRSLLLNRSLTRVGRSAFLCDLFFVHIRIQYWYAQNALCWNKGYCVWLCMQDGSPYFMVSFKGDGIQYQEKVMLIWTFLSHGFPRHFFLMKNRYRYEHVGYESCYQDLVMGGVR